MKKHTLLLLFLTLLLVFYHGCEAYKGLFISTLGTKSHLNFYGGIMEALSDNGHEITFVSPHKTNFNIENLTQIQLKENFNDKLLGNPFDLDNGIFQKFIQVVPDSCVNAYTDPGVQEALKQKYDYLILPIFYAECFLGYAYKNKIPVIYASPNSVASPYSERLGAVEFSSVTPSKLLTHTFPFSFAQRISLLLSNVPFSILTNYLTKRTESLARERNIWDDQIPETWRLLREPSIVLVNGVRALEIPSKSTPPNVIYAGGIHIKSPKPLPNDLSEWLDGSGEEGVILFSLGTGIKAEHMRIHHIEILIKVFRGLKQRVVWKFDSTIKNLPSNIKLSPWLPQQDILAHPKTRLFITHGGLFSCMEATYFEVPVLGMPVFMDQKMNVAEIVNEGWGRRVDWENLTEDKLRDAVLEALTNTSLGERIKHRSVLMKDQLRQPKEEVSYWVNYAIRHQGARHLQSPVALLPWYQLYNVDVWLFIILSSVAILVIFIKLMKFCTKLCMRKFIKIKFE